MAAAQWLFEYLLLILHSLAGAIWRRFLVRGPNSGPTDVEWYSVAMHHLSARLCRRHSARHQPSPASPTRMQAAD